MPDDDLTDAIATVAAADPEISAMVRGIAMDALKKLKYYLANGSPQIQMQILRSFIPALIREMNRGEDDDGMNEIRKEFEDMRREMLSGVPGAETNT